MDHHPNSFLFRPESSKARYFSRQTRVEFGSFSLRHGPAWLAASCDLALALSGNMVGSNGAPSAFTKTSFAPARTNLQIRLVARNETHYCGVRTRGSLFGNHPPAPVWG